MAIWQDTLAAYNNKIAVSWFENHTPQRYTYAQLNDVSNELARRIHNLVERVDDNTEIIGVHAAQGSPSWMVAILACWKLGHAVTLLDTELSNDKLKYRLRAAGVTCIISDDLNPKQLKKDLGIQVQVLPYQDNEISVTSYPAYSSDALIVDEKQLAYVCFTSGSTGTPKAVAISHAGIPGLIAAHIESLQLSDKDKSINLSGLSYDVSWMNCFLMFAGVECLLWAPNEMPLSSLSQVVTDQQVTFSIMIPTFLSSLNPDKFPTLNTILTTGEAAAPELLSSWLPLSDDKQSTAIAKRKIVIGYGPTEDTVGSTLSEFKHGDSYCTLGHPMYDREIYLLDKNFHQIKEPNVKGEIFLAGKGVALGYLKDSILSKKLMHDRFIDVSQTNLQTKYLRIYRTGDCGLLSDKYELIFKGRLDRQIKLRERRVELDEIELVISEGLAATKKEGCFAKICPIYKLQKGQKVVTSLAGILVHPKEIGTQRVERIIADTRQNIADYQDMPDVWYRLSYENARERGLFDIKKNKFDIRKCQQQLNEGTMSHLLVPVYTATSSREGAIDKLSEAVAEIVKQEIGLDMRVSFSVICDIDLPDLGVNSNKTVCLIAALKKQFDIDVSHYFLHRHLAGSATHNLKDLVAMIASMIVHQACFESIIPFSNLDATLYCFPPVSGDPRSKFKKLQQRWQVKQLPLNITGFVSPVVQNAEKASLLDDNFRKAFHYYDSHRLWENINLMSDSISCCLISLQLYGPFYLAGYSWGCDLAHAVALKLQQRHHTVACLALIDGVPPTVVHQSLLQSNDILKRELYGKIFAAIAGVFKLRLPSIPDKEFDAIQGTPIDKCRQFYKLVERYLSGCTLDNSHLDRAKAVSDLHLYINSCIRNFQTSASCAERSRIEAKHCHTILFHTMASSASNEFTCLHTTPSRWSTYVADLTQTHYVEVDHLELFDDNNFIEQFCAEVEQSLNMTLAKTFSHSHRSTDFIPPRNAAFTGRRDQLAQLTQLIEQRQQKIIVHGMGGIGKSQLLIELAHQLAEDMTDTTVLLLSQSNLQETLVDFLIARGQCELNQNYSIGILFKKLFSQLCQLPRAVLMIDDLQTYDDIKAHVPSELSNNTTIVCAARSAARLPKSVFSFALDIFQDEEAVEYIRRKLPNSTVASARKLADRLGCYPLAIALSVAFCQNKEQSLDDYIHFLNESIVDAQGNYLSDVVALEENYDATLESILEHSLRLLKEHRDGANLTLFLHSMLLVDNNNIPMLHLKKQLAVILYPEATALVEHNSLDRHTDFRSHRSSGILSLTTSKSNIIDKNIERTLERYISILSDMAFVSADTANQTISMHNLTHELLFELEKSNLTNVANALLTNHSRPTWIEFGINNLQSIKYYYTYWQHMMALCRNLIKLSYKPSESVIMIYRDLYMFFNFHYAYIEAPDAVGFASILLQEITSDHQYAQSKNLAKALGELLFFVGFEGEPVGGASLALNCYRRVIDWDLQDRSWLDYGIFRLLSRLYVDNNNVDIEQLYHSLIEAKQISRTVLIGYFAGYQSRVRGDFVRACQLYRQQKGILEIIYKLSKTQHNLHQLAVCMHDLANHEAILGQFSRAIINIEQSIFLKTQFYNNEITPHVENSMIQFFEILVRMGNVAAARQYAYLAEQKVIYPLYQLYDGQYAVAISHLKKELHNANALAAKNSIYKNNLTVSLIRMGQVAFALENYPRAARYFQRACQNQYGHKLVPINYSIARLHYLMSCVMSGVQLPASEFSAVRNRLKYDYQSDDHIFMAYVDIYEARYHLLYTQESRARMRQVLGHAFALIEKHAGKYANLAHHDYLQTAGDFALLEAHQACSEEDKIAKYASALHYRQISCEHSHLMLNNSQHPAYIRSKVEKMLLEYPDDKFSRERLKQLLSYRWIVSQQQYYPQVTLQKINDAICREAWRLVALLHVSCPAEDILSLSGLTYAIKTDIGHAVLLSIMGEQNQARRILMQLLTTKNNTEINQLYLQMIWSVFCYQSSDYLTPLNEALSASSCKNDDEMRLYGYEIPYYDKAICDFFTEKNQSYLDCSIAIITFYYGAKAAIKLQNNKAYKHLLAQLEQVPTIAAHDSDLKAYLSRAIQDQQIQLQLPRLSTLPYVVNHAHAGLLFSQTYAKTNSPRQPQFGMIQIIQQFDQHSDLKKSCPNPTSCVAGILFSSGNRAQY